MGFAVRLSYQTMLANINALPADAELTTKELAPLIGVKPDTLDRMRSAGRGPSYLKYGDGARPRIRYQPAKVRAWLADHYTGQVETHSSSVNV